MDSTNAQTPVATVATVATVANDNTNGVPKRKRSPSSEPQPTVAPPAKAAKTHSSHLQINYLTRQYSDILPLVSIEDSLPTILQLLGDYGGVIERHESLAGNLGARPLGPMLIKRFERLFDGPPRVLKCHGKEGTIVSWLDVVEFARHKPEQFNLEKMRDGVRVCQFYTKQSRVEISEDDFFLISSGMPQKLIPPQPIPEDEEKELGTLEIMEKSIAQVVQLADQVSARARQFKHRLLSRKNAIINRRENEAVQAVQAVQAAESASGDSVTADSEQRNVGSPTSASGFVAINRSSKEGSVANGPPPATNGKSAINSASAATRAELLSHFSNIRERQGDLSAVDATPPNVSRAHSSKPKSKQASNSDMDYASILLNSASPVPIPNTPSNLVHQRPTQAERLDDSGPYKAEMLSRMETLQRGDRVLPPCDRCRRLHMDCLKNLTACQGCTRKHAKCSWKDVTEQELIDNPRSAPKEEGDTLVNGEDKAATVAPSQPPPSVKPEGPPQPVRDEELLGEDDSDDDIRPSMSAAIRNAEPELARVQLSEVAAEATRRSEAEEAAAFEHNAADLMEPQELDYKPPVPETAQRDVQAAAVDVLNQPIVEIPNANAGSGFSPINRSLSESMPEVRIHEPSQELPGTQSAQFTPKTETFPVEDIKPDVTPEPNAWNDQTLERPSMSYRPYE